MLRFQRLRSKALNKLLFTFKFRRTLTFLNFFSFFQFLNLNFFQFLSFLSSNFKSRRSRVSKFTSRPFGCVQSNSRPHAPGGSAHTLYARKKNRRHVTINFQNGRQNFRFSELLKTFTSKKVCCRSTSAQKMPVCERRKCWH